MGTVTLKWIDAIPPCLLHLHQLAAGGQADSYRDGDRIAYIKITDYDRRAFSDLEAVDNIYMVYKKKEVTL